MQPTPEMYPPPQGGAGPYRGAPASPGHPGAGEPTREARLRGTTVYRRSGSPQEIEADLGTFRALESLARPLSQWIKLAAALAFGLSLLVGFALGAAFSEQPAAFLVPVALGIAFAIFALLQLRLVTWIPRDKLEMASSLLRRMDLARGSTVNISLDLADFDSTKQRPLNPTRGLPTWHRGFNNTYCDPWLTLEAQLSNGVSVRLTRSSYRLQFVMSRRSGNRTITTTRTSHTFEDGVELLYDAQKNLNLGHAGAAPFASIRLERDRSLNAFQNQPGSLSMMAATDLRADRTNRMEEMVNLASQALLLVDPTHYVFLVDREAWPPGDDPEIRRRGVLGQLRVVTQKLVLPSPKLIGGVVLMLAGLALGVLAYYQVGHVHARQEFAADHRKSQKEYEQQPAAASGAPAEHQNELKTKIAQHKEDAERYDGDVVEEKLLGVAELVGLLVCLAGGAALLASSQKKTEAPALAPGR